VEKYKYCGGTPHNNGYERNTLAPAGDNLTHKNDVLSYVGQINFYPNPNNGNFVVENNTENALASIEIIDLTGKVVYSTQTNNIKSEINIGNIQNGIYIIHSYNEHINTRSKIIISK
jgi:Secretion system C-terminal sorting domain